MGNSNDGDSHCPGFTLLNQHEELDLHQYYIPDMYAKVSHPVDREVDCYDDQGDITGNA